MTSNIARATALAFVLAAPVTTAAAQSGYDGYWNLAIATQRGPCDRNYNFGVQVANGIVTFTGPANLTGRVAPNGAVRVNVAAGDKTASGSGRLNRNGGNGRWTGRSGKDRCAGTWTARRF